MKKFILSIYLSVFTSWCFAQQQSFEFFRWNEVEHPLNQNTYYNGFPYLETDSKGNIWTLKSNVEGLIQLNKNNSVVELSSSRGEKAGYDYKLSGLKVDEADNKILLRHGSYYQSPSVGYDYYIIIADTFNNIKYIHPRDLKDSDTTGYWRWSTALSLNNNLLIVTDKKFIWKTNRVNFLRFDSLNIKIEYDLQLFRQDSSTLIYAGLKPGGDYQFASFHSDGTYNVILPGASVKDYSYSQNSRKLTLYSDQGVYIVQGKSITKIEIPDFEKIADKYTPIKKFHSSIAGYSIEGFVTNKGISVFDNNKILTLDFATSIGRDSAFLSNNYSSFKHINLQKDSTLTFIMKDQNTFNPSELLLLIYKKGKLSLKKSYNVKHFNIPSFDNLAVYSDTDNTYFYSFPIHGTSFIQIINDTSTKFFVTDQKCSIDAKGSDVRADENYFWISNEYFSDTSHCKVVRFHHNSFVYNGNIFYDTNADGIKENSEITYSELKLIVKPSGLIVLPGQYGKFSFTGNNGSAYTVKVLDSTRFSSVKINNSTYTVGVKLKEEKPEVLTSFWIPASRCNTTRSGWISLTNNGVVPVQKAVIKLSSNDKMKLLQNNIPVDSAVFTFNNLSLQQSLKNDFDIKWAEAEQVGQTATLKIVTELYTNDILVATKLDSVQSIIRCSFDPNDKSVTPSGVGEEHFTLLNSTLQYLIRFENTGNDTAYNVVVYDTLNPALDYATLKVTGYSHPVNTEISKNGIVAFHFNNIMLPDKTTGSEKAHGFVRFSINHKADAADHTNICNKAAIVFDENKPIITNEACNLLVEKYPVTTGIKDLKKSTTSIYPNPATDKIALPENTISFTIADSYGIEMAANSKDVSGLAPGIYIVKLKLADGTVETEKLIISR